MIDKETIQRANNYPILEVAERLGLDVDSDNKSYCIRSHDEKTKSMSFDVAGNYFNCFGCGVAGDTIKLVREVNSCAFREAVMFILEEETLDLPNRRVPFAAPKPSGKRHGASFSDIYKHLLQFIPFPSKDSYLTKERCLSQEVLIANDIKCISDKADKYLYKNVLLDYFPEELLIKSGALRLSAKGFPYFFFWDCDFIFPFFEGDKIIYLQGIFKDKSPNKPKIKNLPSLIEKPLLYQPKEFSFYPLSKETHVYLAEGVIDSLSFLSMGAKSASIIDAGLKKGLEELNVLKPFNVALAIDFDNAGFEAKLKIAEHCKKNHFSITNLNISELAKDMLKDPKASAKDINEILTKLKRGN